MAAEQQWFLKKLGDLEIEDDKIEILTEIKSRLDTTTSFEITSNFLTQSQIYDCAYDKSEEQSQLVYDILALCLSTLDINRTDFSKHLIKSLKHRNPKIRALALEEIYKNLSKNSASVGLTDNLNLDQDITLLVLKSLGDDETEVAGPAIKILSIILRKQLENSIIRDAFKSKLEERDVVKIRVYEVAVNLSKSDSSLLFQLQDILASMLKELDSDDILFQMNLLELLVSLAEQNHGFLFLEDKKIFDKIAARIETIEQDPLVQLLIPGFMKFFGKVAFYHPKKILEGYPKIISYLFSSFTNIDTNILPVALDTIGNIAYPAEGKIILDEKFPEQMKETMEEYLFLLRNLPTDVKCRVFSSLQMVFTHEDPPNNRIDLITNKWCSSLVNSEHDLSALMEYCKNPFPDIKISCLTFIRTLCSYRWGVDAVKNTASLLEFLLDRSVEFDKNVKFIKFEVISVLAETDLFDTSTLLQLKKYVAEGPYFIEPVMEIAVD
ncbi:26S proteasome non-ATPase regulatory subunit 5 [Condylostylus longicornis]|uniref:26S proteasome non-ATPase regulatory subunit 5 n=1 Tax=Condylostylus longicornis TaxID=2530218 RepID=UPI00244E41DD|nr:26S proteasome non-ATPase regulatory subunit 5 [Condylostylus longicornis]